MIGLLLNILATIGIGLFYIICSIWGSIESKIRGEYEDWQHTLAEAKDIYGNILIKYPANWILIKRSSPYKFGQLPDKISEVLGRNKALIKLEESGKVISDGLNSIDKNHVENAINKNK